MSCRNTSALRRGQSSRETPSFWQCLWICAHTSPIFRLMNSLFSTLRAWNTPEMRSRQQCYKYTSFIFIHELPHPRRRMDEWPCQGKGGPGAKAYCLGLLGGGSSSDKAQSLQEEMFCWLKAFMEGALWDLSGRGVWNLLNSQIWSILWNQANQFACLYISYLTSVSQKFNNSTATVKPEIKEQNKKNQ